MDKYSTVIDEKEILIARDEEEAAGAARVAPAREDPRSASLWMRFLRFSAWSLLALSLINAFQIISSEVDLSALQPSCGGRPHHEHGQGHGHGHGKPHIKGIRPFDERHHIPDVSKWVKYDGPTDFEIAPSDVAGLTVEGGRAFGKVVFETSKLSDKIAFELDVRTNRKPDEGDISVELADGLITVKSPNTGDLETYASAKVTIPSNIIGKFGVPRFEVDAPRHMVDLSGLPESLEIGELKLRLAKGFVKAGKVHTNKTDITVAKGGVRGALRNAREDTSIDVADGNVVVDLVGTSGGHDGKTSVKLGNGQLNGTFDVYAELSLNVAKGNIWADVAFPELDLSDDDEIHKASFSTKVGSGDARVYVDGELKDRTVDASHTAVNGRHLLTYPADFEGTVDVRALVGDIVLAGEGLSVEKSLFGRTATKGDADRNKVTVRNAKGDVDVLIGEQ